EPDQAPEAGLGGGGRLVEAGGAGDHLGRPVRRCGHRGSHRAAGGEDGQPRGTAHRGSTLLQPVASSSQVSFRSELFEGSPPPKTTSTPRARSKAIRAWVRGARAGAISDQVPFQSQVSPRSWAEGPGSKPPNTTTPPSPGSYCIAWWTRGPGPAPATEVHWPPSKVQTSSEKVLTSCCPPNSTASWRDGSNAIRVWSRTPGPGTSIRCQPPVARHSHVSP